MSKIIDILLRIIASPCVLILHLIIGLYKSLYGTTLFLLHGGEFIIYRKNDKKTIYDLYMQLKSFDEESKRDEN